MKSRYTLVTLAVTLFVLMIITSAFAQSTKDAVRSLKKLEAHLETGTSLRDYSQALGDAKFEVNLFLESKEAKNNSKLTELIQKIMEEYEDAKFVFKEKSSGPYRRVDSIPDIYDRSISRMSSESGKDRIREKKNAKEKENQYYRSLLSKYPEANRPIEDGGALTRNKSDIGKDDRTLDLSKLFPLILNQASKDLKQATKMLAGE